MSKTKSKYKQWLDHLKTIERYDFGPIELHYNEEGRLHHDLLPAYTSPTTLIHYSNGLRHGISVDKWGSRSYYYSGVLVPSHYITNPESLTFEEIMGNPNVEVRSVGIRIYGFERMLQEDLMDVIELEKKTNYMLLKFNAKDPDESFCVVRVFNGTLNEDGSRDTYYLVVPPNMKTVREAVAWTFYKEADDYQPIAET